MSNDRFLPPFSQAQQKAIAIVPKITAFPSILGVLYIIQHILRSKKRRQQTYHRLLLGMSCMDLLYATKSFLSTWILPAQVPSWGTEGTAGTCTAWGFLGHGGALTSILYNGSLALYYLLTIVHGWKPSRMKSLEAKCLHTVPFIVGWGTALVPLIGNWYHAVGWTCWIGTDPPVCGGSTGIPCLHNASPDFIHALRWALFHAELWAIWLVVVICMIIIYLHLRKQEQAMAKYSIKGAHDEEEDGYPSASTAATAATGPGASHIQVQPTSTTQQSSLSKSIRNKQLSLSQKFARQAMWYVLVFLLAWLWPMVMWVQSSIRDDGKIYYPILFLTVLFNPLQGFFDFVIYIRPRWLAALEQKRRLQQQQQQSTASFAAPRDRGPQNDHPGDHSTLEQARPAESRRDSKIWGGALWQVLVDMDQGDDEEEVIFFEHNDSAMPLALPS